MMRTGWLVLTVMVTLGAPPASAQKPLPSIETRTQGLTRTDGLLPFWFDSQQGALWVELAKLGTDLLLVPALATGLGSNPVGLDRGRLGDEKVVRFERVGRKVLLIERNLRHRSAGGDAAARRAVEESFAESVLWGGTVAAESDGHVLVDLSGFVTSDVAGVAAALKQARQGAFKLDDKRSALRLDCCRGFPKNTELEATLTFACAEPGGHVRSTAPTPEALSLRQRLSFIELPPPGYEPRAFDPRAGAISIAFADHSTPIDAPLMQRWIRRHRLEKRDPTAMQSEAKEPIVYYVDRGAPEPVRAALIEGASWWARAFEVAGFKNAFRVELMPEDMDPLDVRHNVIQWVHRSTRGWSYGRSVIDPRTGEILKGHVTLGALRARQDRLIFDGITPAGDRGAGAASCGAGGGPDACCFVPFDARADAVSVTLARIRQLAAHEVGHTLGFAHNFAASTFDRASVMDYPAPLVQLGNAGEIDLSQAYATGIGAWDVITVRYAYSEWPDAEAERAGLAAILAEAKAQGMVFLTDQDARPAGAAHPLANLWDNGKDPIRELTRVMEVRAATLARFGVAHLRKGRPQSELEELLVPLYLQHRYQVEATAKCLGGVHYEYTVEADPNPTHSEPPVRQERALEALLGTLALEALLLPEAVARALVPPHWGSDAEGERFPGRTGAPFDEVAAARCAADITLGALLQPERAERLVQQSARDARFLGFHDVVKRLVTSLHRSEAESKDRRRIALRRALQHLVVERLIAVAEDRSATEAVRAIAEGALVDDIRGQWYDSHDVTGQWHGQAIDQRIQRFRARTHADDPRQRDVDVPAGSPIGK